MADSNSVVVFNFTDLKNAIITNNGITTIYLGGNIQMTSGGIVWPSFKAELTIDGFYPQDETGTLHTFTDADSSSVSDSIYLGSSSASISITMKNMIIVGKNYYGSIGILGSSATSGIVITYENVTYSGPQAFYNRYGKVRCIDSSFVIDNGNGTACSRQELMEVNRVEFGGHISVLHTSTGNSCFWFLNSNAAFTILPDADITITVTGRELFYCDAQPDITIGQNAVVRFDTLRGLFYGSGHQAKTFLLDKSAALTITQTKRNSGVATVICNGNFTVEENASLCIKVDLDNSDPLIQFGSANTVTFNNPKSIVLYNRGNLALSWSSSSNSTFSAISELAGYWTTPSTLSTGGDISDIPLYNWRKADNSDVTVTALMNSTATKSVTSNIITGTDAVIVPSTATFNLMSAKVLSFGRIPLSMNTITDQSEVIQGTTLPLSILSLTYMNGTLPVMLLTTADADGNFVFSLPSRIPISTSVILTVNKIFKNKIITLLTEGALIFKTLPEILPFRSTGIPLRINTLKRIERQWEITVSDTRINGSEWKMYASLAESTVSENRSLEGDIVFVADDNVRTPLTQTPISVYSGKGNTETETETSVRWEEEFGILIDINPSKPYQGGTYTARLNLTLVPDSSD